MPLPGVPNTRSDGHQRKLNAIAYSHLIAALVAGGKTKMELVEACGLSELLVLRLVKELRARGARAKGRNDVLHISGWHPDRAGRMTVREYTLGPGRDVEQPVVPRDEVVRRYLLNRKRREHEKRDSAIHDDVAGRSATLPASR